MDFRKIFLLAGMAATIFFFTQCFRDRAQQDPRGMAYAGSVKCISCHKSISSSYGHTAHSLSTRIADDHSVAGSFSKDSNLLIINDTAWFGMEKKKAGLYQVLYQKNRQTAAQR